MDKTEFERVDGGIENGDLILVVKPDSFFPTTHISALVGAYDPIEDGNHWYIKYLERQGELQKSPNLKQRLIGNVFFLTRNPTIDVNNLQLGIHEFSTTGGIDVRYTNCRYVKLLMKASELERILYSHK